LSQLGDHHDWVESLAFSPDGKTLASGGFDFTIKLWQPSAGSGSVVSRGELKSQKLKVKSQK
jgi:WD40 repeat protein